MPNTTIEYTKANDLPLMKLVTNPVAVNADDILKAYAEKHGWSHISLH